MRSFGRSLVAAAAVLFLVATPALYGQASNVEKLYADARALEAALRKEIGARAAGAAALPLVNRGRILVRTYEDIARLFPRSAYSDNALWQGAALAGDTFWEFGEAADRATALRLFKALGSRYPTSSLNKNAPAHIARLTAATPPAAAAARAAATPAASLAALTAIRREVLADTLRVTLELDREESFHDERLDGPPRVFVDLTNTRTVDALKDVTLAYGDDVVRQIRVGRQIGGRTRVVLDLQDAARHSVYTLYNPYRVVIDVERPGTTVVKEAKTPPAKAPKKEDPGLTVRRLPLTGALPPVLTSYHESAQPPAVVAIAPATSSPVSPTTAGPSAPVSEAVSAPIPPSTNRSGGFSLSRQLGLGIARVVIDPGHGGHDPGAQVKGLSEADLVLDVALRLEKLLLKQPGVEVVLTRRGNEYVPLEERTALANREEADLFLSIHANASADTRARGIETYFLNFAPNPQAEAIAARENAGSAKTMRSLPDIVRAIALNNKIDESRDFATLVQSAMVERLKKSNKTVRSLGVRQAPFMVLIGATMPSVLAEVSFITNREEAGLLKTQNYRQQIAEALLNGVMRYQKSLKAGQMARQ